MWTVYDRPADYPDKFVARRFDVGSDGRGPTPSDSVIVAPDLEMLRYILAFQLHLVCLTRSPEDDPNIVETWL